MFKVASWNFEFCSLSAPFSSETAAVIYLLLINRCTTDGDCQRSISRNCSEHLAPSNNGADRMGERHTERFRWRLSGDRGSRIEELELLRLGGVARGKGYKDSENESNASVRCPVGTCGALSRAALQLSRMASAVEVS
jgi:hypothetical protein